MYKNGGQKKNVKCLCKNGQNGDPAWKKSCTWSFNDAPWSTSDVTSIQCKRKTGFNESQSEIKTTNPSTTQSVTSTTTTTTSTTTKSNSYTFFIPNDLMEEFKSHRLLSTTPFAQVSENTVEISKVCNPDYTNGQSKSPMGKACGRRCPNNLYITLRFAVQNQNGLWETQFNCPECGCGSDEEINFNEVVEEGRTYYRIFANPWE